LIFAITEHPPDSFFIKEMPQVAANHVFKTLSQAYSDGMSIFSQGQGRQGVTRRRSEATSHKEARSRTQRLAKSGIPLFKA
jgi:hypothetical protein